ncbi:MAG: cytochrome c oxidase subunit II [Actinomycetota bacterium]
MRRPAARSAIVLVVAGATVALSACSSSFGMPRGASEQGRDIFNLWQVFMIAGIVVGAIVYGLIGWSLLRYRRRRSDDDEALGRQFHGHVPLEVVYTAIPVVIVIALFSMSFRTEQRVADLAPDPSVTLSAEAFAWGWRFTYEGRDVTVLSDPSGENVTGPEIALPRGETVRVVLTSDDVIHAFWVPDFLFKRDAIPGHVNRFDVTPTDSGTYQGVCAEFCGLNHAYMTFRVTVMEPDAFESWLDERRGEEVAT